DSPAPPLSSARQTRESAPAASYLCQSQSESATAPSAPRSTGPPAPQSSPSSPTPSESAPPAPPRHASHPPSPSPGNFLAVVGPAFRGGPQRNPRPSVPATSP